MSPGLADILFVQPQASAAVRIKQNGLTVLCPRAGIVCRLVQRQSLRRLHAGSVGGADNACPAMSANNLPDMPMSEMSAHPPDIDLRGTSKLCPSFIRSGTLMRMWRAGCAPSTMSTPAECWKVAPGSRVAGASLEPGVTKPKIFSPLPESRVVPSSRDSGRGAGGVRHKGSWWGLRLLQTVDGAEFSALLPDFDCDSMDRQGSRRPMKTC